MSQKCELAIEYSPLIKVEGVSLKEFRSQRIEVLDHTALIFTSRTTVDSFFKVCEQARITIPETMKYLCSTEAIALYLQKYIVYRKRKISFADGSFTGLMDLIVKNKAEKLLLTLTEPHKPELVQTMEKLKLKFDQIVLARTVSADLSTIDPAKYQLAVLYSPAEVTAFLNGFEEDKRPMVATFGDGTTRFAIAHGLSVRAMAPTPQAPSMAKAIELFVSKINAGEDVEPVVLADNHQAEDFVKAVQAKDSRRYKSKKTTAATTTTKK
ncbi:MAG: uroporphyrinogen-III synthase [Rikenellaceae bacterium]|nr:uroporphyrinogen-III synthase [Rikenellaceae bacterium]